MGCRENQRAMKGQKIDLPVARGGLQEQQWQRLLGFGLDWKGHLGAFWT
jgi:hypothetical protein